METDPVKRVSFVRQRFLRDKPAGVFRIVAFGGSSVNYLEPEFKELERDLSAEFDQFDQIEIINCGGLAYGSHRLALVMREMLEYQPDLILLYSGHNEFEEIEQLSLSGLKHLSFESYMHNLRLILTTARNQQVPVIMGTVSSNLLRPYLPRDGAAIRAGA